MRRSQRKRRKHIIFGLLSLLVVIGGACAGLFFFTKKATPQKTPQEVFSEYIMHISKKEYKAMYSMLAKESVTTIPEEEYIERNKKIYEGIEIQDIQLKAEDIIEEKNNQVSIRYQMSFDTLAGNVSFHNKASFVKKEEGYQLLWDDNLIFPDLKETDKVRVSTTAASRGQILDRNAAVLAGKGAASSVGIVPGKLKDKEESLNMIAELLGTEREGIEKKLSEKWVKEDSFVPLKTIPKVKEEELLTQNPDKEVVKEKERQDKLLEIPGVMISNVEVRGYPLGKAASHLVGYVQTVTAEDIEKHPGEGYQTTSVIGKSGMEALYEKELKGQDGCDITIVNEAGNVKKTLASLPKEDGEDIQLTIDASLQTELYKQFKSNKGCSVAMNPYTGEVLALVSTPSFDDNDFILGLSQDKWNQLNEEETRPLYNRFRQTWCPGSTFKPIIAAIGLKTGAITPEEDYGQEGLSWQKDESWGSYHVTTLHEYHPVILENALIYSDNIYFAKAALKIGADNLMKALNELGFKQELPFEITMSKSQYSNTDTIDSEIQLADSGYGQGQVLVNPLHIASIYTMFSNDGNIIKPYLRYEQNPKSEIWIPQAVSSETASQVVEGLKKVVNDPHGTAYDAHRDDIELAGKTGTAEIKASKEDDTGTELGWFSVFTTDKNSTRPVLIVSMVEDVKDIGGSAYVVKKEKKVLEKYLKE